MTIPSTIIPGGRTAVYVANLLVSFHYFIIIYINSTYLATLVSTEVLSMLYLVGSALSVGLFVVFSRIVRQAGNFYLFLGLSLLEVLALVGLAVGQSAAVVAGSFLLYLAVSPILYLNLDIFLERLTTKESQTGSIRGLFLTMQNIAQVVSPLLVGLLLFSSEYWLIYGLSLVFLAMAVGLVSWRLRRLNDARYHPRSIGQSWSYVIRHPRLRNAVVGQALLRFFYAWMVIYVPLYLLEVIGFSWPEIGVMFSVMLLPFLLLEYPLGRLVDIKKCERPIMAGGLLIMAMASLIIPFIGGPSLLLWTGVLCFSRIGAACLEIGNESYFFRHVDGSQADLISLFRVARPAMYVLAAAVAWVSLLVLTLQWSFVVLGVILLAGLLWAEYLRPSSDQSAT